VHLEAAKATADAISKLTVLANFVPNINVVAGQELSECAV
jgi:hypothetical protein